MHTECNNISKHRCSDVFFSEHQQDNVSVCNKERQCLGACASCSWRHRSRRPTQFGDGRISHQPEDAPQGGGWHRPAVLSSPEAQVIDVEVDDRGTWREPSFAQVGVPHCCKVKHGGIVFSYDFYVTRPHTELPPQSLAEYAQAVRSFFPHGKALKSIVEGSSRRCILPSRIRPRCLGCQALSLLMLHLVGLRVFQPPTGGPRGLSCVRRCKPSEKQRIDERTRR